ncbi:MAG: hypothetical protein Sapg2KO_47700 [Saprospiraceae bacterium]
MKTLKYLSFLFLGLLLIQACTEDEFYDIAIAPPSNVSLLAKITTDDSGLVTLVPAATGAAYFEVYFDGSTTTPVTVNPGEGVDNVYAEGSHAVRIVAFGPGGAQEEITQTINVQFAPPENLALQVNVDPVNTNVITFVPSADNALNFDFFFGDVENEEATTIMEGADVTHTYAETGSYDVRVIAKSASSTTIDTSFTLEVVKPTVQLTLPIDFEDPEVTYSFVGFGGADLSLVDNPDQSGENTSGKVAQLVKNNGSEVWAGGFLQVPEPIDLSQSTDFTMKVWSPKQGATVKMKLENATDGNIGLEIDAVTTTSGAWENLTYDFSAIDQSQTYQKIVVFMDFGNAGDSSVYYFDEIVQGSGIDPATLVGIPTDFESSELNYQLGFFGRATSEIIDNPDASGINTSGKVVKLNKSDGSEVWAGTSLKLDRPIDFAQFPNILVDVWSPKQGIPIRLKVENSGDPAIFGELDVNTTTSNGWETLTWDFSGIDMSQSYDVVVLFFDFGTAGDNSDYYFDNIRHVNPPEVLAIPLDFESATQGFPWGGFGRATAEVIDNPDASGINTSSRVTKLNKSDGSEVWAGASLKLDEPMNFEEFKKIDIDVWSPKQGATVRLKVENSSDNTIFAELDATTTTSNAWETLSWDFVGIDASQTYDLVVLFFDFQVAGDGSDYYFDNVRYVAPDANEVPLTLPITFDVPNVPYVLAPFGDATAQVIANPDVSGLNTSGMVGEFVKVAGAQTWAGTTMILPEPIALQSDSKFEVLVWSPKQGANILFKLENGSDSGKFFEIPVPTTTSNAWELMEFDLSGINLDNSYSKVILFFDFGTPGDGSIYYFDDIVLK